MVRFLLFTALVAVTTYAQGTWTPIMNVGGSTGDGSTQFYIWNSGTTPDPVVTTETTIATSSPLTLSINSGVIQQTGTAGTCPNTGTETLPGVAGQTYISYQGPTSYPTESYKGLAAQATFRYNSADVTSYSDGADLEQSVFFHEAQCYNGGREYGILLNGLTGGLEFYALTNANEGGGYATGTSIPASHTVGGTNYVFLGNQYIYEMWPVKDIVSGVDNCYFNLAIVTPAPSYITVWTGQIMYSQLTGVGIIGFDSGFCAGVENEQGYVTATTKASAPITFNYDMMNSPYDHFQMSLAGIWVGK